MPFRDPGVDLYRLHYGNELTRVAHGRYGSGSEQGGLLPTHPFVQDRMRLMCLMVSSFPLYCTYCGGLTTIPLVEELLAHPIKEAY